MKPCLAILLGGLWAAAPAWAEADPQAFLQLCQMRARQAEEAGVTAVQGLGDWLFFAPELRHLAAGPFWGAAAPAAAQTARPEHADPLAAIVAFGRQLEAIGVDLIVMPVPAKAAVYADSLAALPAPPPRLDRHHQDFYRLLRREGVAVLDLMPLFLAGRQPGEALYCRGDTHWSGRACVLAAQAVAAALRPQPWLAAMSRSPFTGTWRRVEITGDLRRGEDSAETVALRFVSAAAGEGAVMPDRSSPILLLGDSHTLVFQAGGDMHAVGAGLADQLALELGLPVDLLGVRGSGSTSARISLYRRSRADSAYLAGKKAVVWCFSAREFTESTDGWPPVPVAP